MSIATRLEPLDPYGKDSDVSDRLAWLYNNRRTLAQAQADLALVHSIASGEVAIIPTGKTLGFYAPLFYREKA